MVKAVIFDLFETLVSHRDPNWKPPLRSKAARLGVDQDFYDTNWSRFERRWESGDLDGYHEVHLALCAAAGVEADPLVLDELKARYVSYLARVAFGPADMDVVRMLTALRASGLRLAVVTNANGLDTDPWDAHELSEYFDVFIASHEVGLLKPDPEIYELACHRLGIDPGDAVFVGDGGSGELQGAAEVGIRPLWANWFLDRWPEGVRPGGFAGGEWRLGSGSVRAPFRRLQHPDDLLESLHL